MTVIFVMTAFAPTANAFYQPGDNYVSINSSPHIANGNNSKSLLTLKHYEISHNIFKNYAEYDTHASAWNPYQEPPW